MIFLLSAKFLSEYIEQNAPIIIPSIVDVVGNQLAVRLVAAAGSLSQTCTYAIINNTITRSEKSTVSPHVRWFTTAETWLSLSAPSCQKSTKKRKG